MSFVRSLLICCLISTHLQLTCKEQDYSGSSYATITKALSKVTSLVLEVRIDLHECYAERIRDPKELEAFLTKVCTRLKIADPSDTRSVICDSSLVGGSRGSIFMQVSDSTYIIGRVINESNTVQITVSAPMNYNTQELADLSKKFFGASNMDVKISIRK